MRLTCTACLILLAAPALAETCEFASECIEDSACQETEFSAELTRSGDAATLSTIFGDIALATLNGAPTLVGTGAGFAHMLSVADDGMARYTLQGLEDPMTITYLGTCGAAE